MFQVLHADSRRSGRLVDFMVLGAGFYVSCMLLSVELQSNSFLTTLTYSTILLVFMRLSKRLLASYSKSIGETICQILGNAMGILVGTWFVLLPGNILSVHDDVFVAAMLSGIMVFFVLGTLSPLVYKTSLMHKYSSDHFQFRNSKGPISLQ